MKFEMSKLSRKLACDEWWRWTWGAETKVGQDGL